MTAPAIWPHTDAVATVLDGAGLRVAVAQRPDGAGWQGAPGASSVLSYAIVWPLPMSTLDGTLGDPDDDLYGEWQVTSVGPTAEAAQTIADAARDVLTAHDTVWSIAGRTRLRVVQTLAGGVSRDDEENPPVFYAADRYRLSTTPT